MRADVIVVGLGSMGAATVRELSTRGVSVIGLDRFTPPHERGAHGGESRIIRMAYMEGPVYVPLVRHAFDLWRAMEARTGASLLTVTGGLMLGEPDTVAFGGALATARAHGLPHELLEPDEIRRRFPAFRPRDGEFGLYEEVAGLLRPEAAITLLLDEARRSGADLRTGVVVSGWTATNRGVTVHTAGGDLSAGSLVLAPGAWASDLIAAPVPLRVERRVQHFWRPADPESFAPGRFPIWLWGYGPDQTAYGLPGLTGWVKAAMHHGGEVADPAVGAAPPSPEEVTEMRNWLIERVPALGTGVWLGAKPCLYTLTPDEHFVLGHHPERPNTVVACGFSGHGFKFVPVVGEILADLVLGRPPRFDLSPFDPARFATTTAAATAAAGPVGQSR